MKSACFTGHRVISNSERIRLSELLSEYIRREIKNGLRDFYAGGAVGWDTLCAETVISLRNDFTELRLHLILPCSGEAQTAKWSDKQRKDYYRILESADSVEYISDKYYNGCMKRRNERLVEEADVCLCYYDEKNGRSGTGQTVRLSLEKGIKAINFKLGKIYFSDGQTRLELPK